jgi:hypothetical protein
MPALIANSITGLLEEAFKLLEGGRRILIFTVRLPDWMAKVKLGIGLLLALTGTLSAFSSRAQNPSTYYEEVPRTFYGGLLAGAAFTQVDGDAYAGYNKVGLNAGGIVYARIADKLAASIEITYTEKGARGHYDFRLSGSSDTTVTDYRIKLRYAEIPIQLNFFDRRRSHFGAGFSYAQLITGEEIIETNRGTIETDAYPFRKADVNLLLTGNLHLVKGLFLNARFQYSLFPVRKNHYPGIGRSEQFNNVWVVRMMYLF